MARRPPGFAESAPKKATNVSISADLLAAAKANKINLSQTLEQALERRLRELEAERWLAENRDAVDDYNRRVAKSGVFSAGRRRF